MIVGDCGPKLGMHWSDTGFLRLQNVRVPRDHMLSRYQHVTREGQYVKSPRKRNPYAHYYSMLRVREGICRAAAGFLGKASTVKKKLKCCGHYQRLKRGGFFFFVICFFCTFKMKKKNRSPFDTVQFVSKDSSIRSKEILNLCL